MKHLQNRFVKLIYFVFALAALTCLLPNTNVKAYSVVEGQNIYDDAGLLTNDETAKLQKKIDKVQEKDRVTIYLVTTKDDQGLSSFDYADEFFTEAHIEKGLTTDDAVVFLINMDYREVLINAYGKTEDLIDPNTATSITDNVASYLKDNEYYSASKAGIDDITMYVEKNYIIFHAWFQILAALILSGIIVAIMAFSRKTPMTTNSVTYLDQSNSRLRFHHDNYIRTTVTKVRKPQNNGGSGGGGHRTGGSSGHSCSSGSSRF